MMEPFSLQIDGGLRCGSLKAWGNRCFAKLHISPADGMVICCECGCLGYQVGEQLALHIVCPDYQDAIRQSRRWPVRRI